MNEVKYKTTGLVPTWSLSGREIQTIDNENVLLVKNNISNQ